MRIGLIQTAAVAVSLQEFFAEVFMANVNEDRRRIQRFMGWSALVLFTPWLLIAGLKAVQTYQAGLLDSADLRVVLIGVLGVAFGALMVWVIPSWKARRSSRQ
ncbi:hypothetical protein AU14_04335 [Marinobacter similis]|uniref:Uncharacterized protein n=2 Tax=Marinobacter similis TaxID=1420916 RepID=W5YLP9_9GAMM|nr:hypothetical protein AU14_04335 [Marinobacter similis]